MLNSCKWKISSTAELRLSRLNLMVRAKSVQKTHALIKPTEKLSVQTILNIAYQIRFDIAMNARVFSLFNYFFRTIMSQSNKFVILLLHVKQIKNHNVQTGNTCFIFFTCNISIKKQVLLHLKNIARYKTALYTWPGSYRSVIFLNLCPNAESITRV